MENTAKRREREREREMAWKQNDLPLHTIQTEPYRWLNRLHFVFYTCALFALFFNRLSSLLHSKSALSFTSFYLITVADLVFALMWILAQGFRWNPVRRRAFPENLSAKLTDRELPAIDIFICTADPDKEPPINVANTALSVMAFDYPADKISVYLSDDGGSKLTLFAFMEAAAFAKHWIPFCKEHNIKERNPKAYFSSTINEGYKLGQWSEIKSMYEGMKERVDAALQKGSVSDVDAISDEHRKGFDKWILGFTRKEHPTVVEGLLAADKEVDAMGHAMPNLVYVSREKRKLFHHHFKARALNAMLRVSSVMSNAPIVLNLDCDMYSNDPIVPRRALCFLLDPEQEPDLAFVQFPQMFEGINKNDIYANEYKFLFQINPLGMDGSRGPNYVGTGCFFKRRAFAGKPSFPPHPEIVLPHNAGMNGTTEPIWSKATMEAAHHVAACSYEQGSEWGSTIGFRYGSLVEDFYTGYLLHCEGWRSAYCNPKEAGPCFVGDFPVSLNDMLWQFRRWCVGLLEVVFSSGKCPLTYGPARVNSFTNAMCYAHYSFWPLSSIPILIYALLPQFSLLLGLTLFPKASDPWIYLYIYLFVGAYGQEMLDFMREGGTFTRWWNAQRIWSIRGVSCLPLGLLDYVMQRMGIAMSGFNVTSKVSEDQVAKRYEQGVFEFGVESPFFLGMSAVAMVSLVAFVVGMARAVQQGSLEHMLVQLFISGFVVVNSWPVYEAMVLRSDSGRMPKRVSAFGWLAGGAFLLGAEIAGAYV